MNNLLSQLMTTNRKCIEQIFGPRDLSVKQAEMDAGCKIRIGGRESTKGLLNSTIEIHFQRAPLVQSRIRSG